MVSEVRICRTRDCFQIAPPEQFNFSQSDKWPKWCRRFECFRDASGLSQKGQVHQVNTLVYCMGDATDDILCSLDLSEDDKKVHNTVKGKFEQYFIKRRNIIFERTKFNQRRQKEGESVNSFITNLHCLVEHCDYGELRDRIVFGLLDASVSMKLPN